MDLDSWILRKDIKHFLECPMNKQLCHTGDSSEEEHESTNQNADVPQGKLYDLLNSKGL